MRNTFYGFSFHSLDVRNFCDFVLKHKETILLRDKPAELNLLRDVEQSTLQMPFSELVLNHIDTIPDDQTGRISLYAIISNIAATESKLPIQCLPQAHNVYYIGIENITKITYDLYMYMCTLKEELQQQKLKDEYEISD